MPTTVEALELVGALAMEQSGLITTAQAQALGVSVQQLVRLADADVMERLRHGVYRVAGVPPGPYDDLRAAWLAFSPAKTAAERLSQAPHPEVVTHRSAAWVHQLGDLDAGRLEFTSSARKQSRDPRVKLHRRRLDRQDWTLTQGLPVTTALATIRDLAAARIDGGHLAGVVRDAVTTHHLSVIEVAGALSPYAYHYGAPPGQGAVLLQRLLEVAGVPESTHAVSRLVGWPNPAEPMRRFLADLDTVGRDARDGQSG